MGCYVLDLGEPGDTHWVLSGREPGVSVFPGSVDLKVCRGDTSGARAAALRFRLIAMIMISQNA